jgi:hypothetical protein
MTSAVVSRLRGVPNLGVNVGMMARNPSAKRDPGHHAAYSMPSVLRAVPAVAAVLSDPLGASVPHPSTLEKIARLVGDQAVAGLNEALVAKAAEA